MNLENYVYDSSIQQYKSDIGFRTLVECINENLYVIPKYQRRYRWGKQQVVDLIESLIRGLPIPPIYTWRNADNQLEILDGQQRVMSLFFYYIGSFLDQRSTTTADFFDLHIQEGNTFEETLRKTYKLEKLDIVLKDMQGNEYNADYATLPPKIKRKLDFTTITVVEIKIINENKKDEILRTIFANLNKGGERLSDQETRNGMYNCSFYTMLQEYNRYNYVWRKVWGSLNKVEKDMQLLLKLCAYKYSVYLLDEKESRFGIHNYRKGPKEFMDDFSLLSMKFGYDDIISYQSALDQFLSLFDTKQKFSNKTTLLEGLFVVHWVMRLNKPITDRLIGKILESEGYKKNANQGTSSLKAMNACWITIYNIWINDEACDDERKSVHGIR